MIYGNSGSGKNYSFLGTRASPGLIWAISNEIFDLKPLYELMRIYEIKMSYYEICNENITDLLEN